MHIILIHGGMTFRTREDYLNYLRTREIVLDKVSWKKNLEFENMIMPRMPLADNAHYEDWKIHFERFFDFVEEVVLVGVSLGGIFLAKYLSENKMPVKVKKVILVAPPYDDSLPGEDLCNGFELSSLAGLKDYDVTFFFSNDDDVVPVSEAGKFRKELPDAEFVFLDGMNGHFQCERFKEIEEILRSAVEK